MEFTLITEQGWLIFRRKNNDRPLTTDFFDMNLVALFLNTGYLAIEDVFGIARGDLIGGRVPVVMQQRQLIPLRNGHNIVYTTQDIMRFFGVIAILILIVKIVDKQDFAGHIQLVDLRALVTGSPV